MAQKDWSINPKENEAFLRDLKQEIAKKYWPEFFDQIKAEISANIDKYIGEHLEGMTVNYDLNTHFETNDSESIGYVEIDIGKIEGEHQPHVRSHKRLGKQVEGHTRILKDQAVFTDGEKTITSDTIPDNIILKEFLAPVLDEWLEENLTEDDITRDNT